MLIRKQRRYWEKRILMETGWKTGYLLGYIFLYRSFWQDCCYFTKWICDEGGAPMFFKTYDDAYDFIKKGEYNTNFK